jgi:hypothetical protein
MISSSTFSTCFVSCGKCFANGVTTLWSMLLTWATVCCMLESRKPYKHLHSGSWRENKELQWHFMQTVTFQFRYFLYFLLIVEQDIVFIYDAAFFFLHVCAFVRNMAHISLWYISAFYSVPIFCYIIHKTAIRSRHWSSRATPCTLASYTNRKYVCVIWSEHNYIFSHRIVHKTTCFGPVYWQSSGCIINLTSSYTICAWGTLGGRDFVPPEYPTQLYN